MAYLNKPAGVPGRAVVKKSAQQPRVELPELVEWDLDAVLPTLLLIGGSGRGRTPAVGRLVKAGLRGAVWARG